MAEEYQRETAALNTKVPEPPTAKALTDILHKDGNYTYDNTTDSLEAIRDALNVVDELHDVSAADATANAQINEVIGNKTDTLVEAVGTTKSLMGYLKGLTQLMAQLETPKVGYDYNADADTYKDVVNISDKGVLLGISSSHWSLVNGQWATILITIDGTNLTTLDYFALVKSDTGTDFHAQESISCFFRFDTSLRVQHKMRQAKMLITKVMYTIDA